MRLLGKWNEPEDLRVRFGIPEGVWLAVPEAGYAEGYRTAVRGNPSLPVGSDFISVSEMNAYTPRSALFAAAVHFLPHLSQKPLGQLDEAEERAALTHAIRLAKGLAKQLSVGGWTVAPLPSLKEVLEQASPKPSFRPEWIRMPKKGRCPYCGLTRSFLWRLVSPNAANGYRPPVQSVVLRKEGNTRGARLIHYESLMAHIASMRFDQADTGLPS